MLTIDGSQGEGGGQILRTSLAMSLVTGKPFRIVNIRAGRKKPGLMRQHLTAVQAAREVGRASVEGAAVGSQELTFTPREVVPGEYRFAVGTAGSTTLVAQTVLPALLIARDRSRMTMEGGTHNPFAPPFDFLQKSFLPLVNRMGPKVEAHLERAGFYPAGGGRCTITVEPCRRLTGFDLLEGGKVIRRCARAVVSKLPAQIAERELAVIQQELGWSSDELKVEEVASSRGPGNIVVIEVESLHVTEVFTSFGARGVKAESVASKTVQAVRRYLAADVPVAEHLADQLLVPLAIAGHGSFKTLRPSQHTMTNIDVLKRFLDIEITSQQCGKQSWHVEIKGVSGGETNPTAPRV